MGGGITGDVLINEIHLRNHISSLCLHKVTVDGGTCSGSGSGSTLGVWNAPASFWRWVPLCGHMIWHSSPNFRTMSIVVQFPVIVLCLYPVSNRIRWPHNIWRCHASILLCGCTILVRCFVYFCTIWCKPLRTLLRREGVHFWFWHVWIRLPSGEWHVDDLIVIFVVYRCIICCLCTKADDMKFLFYVWLLSSLSSVKCVGASVGCRWVNGHPRWPWFVQSKWCEKCCCNRWKWP